MSGLIIAAPASGSGKTTITLGLLHALTRRGLPIRSAKSGPDYIDPAFHAAATGTPCLNLDAWAMSPARIRSLAAGPTPLIIEGAMGLFDGAPPDNQGSSAHLARILGLPVVLVIDAARMSGSVAALAEGFARHDPQVHVAGVILNNIGSPRHAAMLRRALTPTGLAIFGEVPRSPGLSHPSRHLGLVQAQERGDLAQYLARAADIADSHLDIDALLALMAAAPTLAHTTTARARPPAQRIAIARDAAFAFTYPHLLRDWRDAGAELQFFSPLANDPAPAADLIYLPGGYPELHAGQIAAASIFMQSLKIAAQTTPIYGECGGYMVLGQSLTDAQGVTHKMADLLPLDTSMAQPKLHLGYRQLDSYYGPFPGPWRGHEFHYAVTTRAEGPPLFSARDAEGNQLPRMGLRQGHVCGSFAHLIDQRGD